MVLKRGEDLDSAFLNLIIAVEKVYSKIILRKKFQLGISRNTNEYMKNFLTNKKQTVCMMAIEPQESEMSIGVSQGPVPGPLVCFIHFVELNEGLPSRLESILEWGRNDKNTFNKCKFQLMRYTTFSNHH